MSASEKTINARFDDPLSVLDTLDREHWIATEALDDEYADLLKELQVS